MRNVRLMNVCVCVATLLLAASSAQAHPGHAVEDAGLVHGLLHMLGVAAPLAAVVGGAAVVVWHWRRSTRGGD